ncbi:ricin-type beta-trefoil lectin domain protein [Streptomyces sp. NPDC050738]|uniref:ricin-type beta-trefoil lectin domain protein n=1 Tax=Streptomyces sp. NPDC050738 TaxID=3154744 RepID=UPI003412D4BE
MRRARALALVVIVALAACLGLAGPAAATGQTPGTYTNYSFPSGTSTLDDVTFGVTVQSDPGRANVFWSHQFGFSNGVGGYIGMQRWRDGGGMFLFSLWDSTGGAAGSSGTYCQTFDETGSGYTCRLNQRFTAGHHYRYRIAPDTTAGWYKATITDVTAGTSFVLGSLNVGSGAKVDTGGMVNWVEYFDWNNNAATCADEPYSKAVFDLPAGTATGGSTATAAISSTSVSSSCPNGAKVTAQSGGSIQEDGIGNSSSGSVTGIAAKCADAPATADGTQLVLWTCNGGNNQNWVRAGDGTLRAAFKCATVSGSAVQLSSCTGAAAQKWQISGESLLNPATGKCLDVTGGGSSEGTALGVYTCTGNANQRWTTPS